MTTPQSRAKALIREHDGVRGAARAIGVDWSLLGKIARGDVATASDKVLAAMGLRREIRFVRIVQR